jgi:hypothetical protein
VRQHQLLLALLLLLLPTLQLRQTCSTLLCNSC